MSGVFPRRWTVIADFFRSAEARWIDDFAIDERLEFRKLPPLRQHGSWHEKTRRTTSAGGWLQHLRHARAAFADRPDGIVCVFPQLAMCAALHAKLRREKPVLVAYTYNLGGFPGGIKKRLARWAASEISLFVVHSPSEVEPYARYLDVPRSQVRFVPLQQGDSGLTWQPDDEAPYILAMGSAHRDYPTLIAAVDALQIPTVIITRASDIEALPKSPYVTFRSGLSKRECLEMMARARLSVTPVGNQSTASGQITFIASMQIGMPVIATACPGTDGYITDGVTGVLVPPSDVAALQAAISELWQDPERRATLADAARTEAAQRFSDAAAGRALQEILMEVDPAVQPAREVAPQA